MFNKVMIFGLVITILLTSCSTSPVEEEQKLSVLAAEGFLADIAQNIAGDRLTVGILLPIGTDAHTYQPTPQDIARLSNSDLFIVNGGGLESWLNSAISSSDGSLNMIAASEGLTPRVILTDGHSTEDGHDHEGDPHFWLDPNNVLTYVDNITKALIQIDPEGSAVYKSNAESYKIQLKELDHWIVEQVSSIPEQHRKIITNHESLGYFADRYGFTVEATILEGSSTDSTISSGHMVELIDTINTSGVTTIFLSREEDSTLALQLAEETGIAINYDLISHSLTEDGETSTYIGIMRHNVTTLMTLK